MRDGLIEDLRLYVNMMDIMQTRSPMTDLMREAADELEKLQKKQPKPVDAVFFSGDVKEQLDKKNKEREEKGLPPL